MSALEQIAKDIHRHRAIGELMGMTDSPLQSIVVLLKLSTFRPIRSRMHS
ncbi:MAG: hypothetical protein WCF33_12235 [Pseudonocardiaceae bacterium]